MEDFKCQRSDAWHQYRKGKIGSSDAAAVMGISPWKTSRQLWEEYKGLRVPFQGSEASKRGSDLEPLALQWVEEKTGLQFVPDVLEHPTYSRIIASLDGINILHKTLLEVKSSDRFYEMAIKGKVFPEIACQIQHQLMVTGWDKALLCCYNGFEGKIIDIERDEDFIQSMLEKELEFLELMDGDVPPASKEDTYIKVPLTEYQKHLVDGWAKVSKEINRLQNEEKQLRGQLIDLGDDGSCILTYEERSILKMQRIERGGNVDWKALCSSLKISENEIKKFTKQQIGYYKLNAM